MSYIYFFNCKQHNIIIITNLLLHGIVVSQALTRAIQPQQQQAQQQQQQQQQVQQQQQQHQQAFSLPGQRAIQPQPQLNMQHTLPASSGHAQLNSVSQMQQAFQPQYQQSPVNRQQQQQQQQRMLAVATLKQVQQQQNRPTSSAELIRRLQRQISGTILPGCNLAGALHIKGTILSLFRMLSISYCHKESGNYFDILGYNFRKANFILPQKNIECFRLKLEVGNFRNGDKLFRCINSWESFQNPEIVEYPKSEPFKDVRAQNVPTYRFF